MRTSEAIALAGIASVFAVFVLAQSGSARAQQQPAPPMQPRQFADRASEGAGATIFGDVCEACHGKENIKEAMSPEMLKQLTPEKLYQSMTTGSMRTHADAAGLTDDQKVAIAEWVSGRRLGSTESGAASTMSNVCATHPRSSEPVGAILERMEPGHDEEQSLPASEGSRRSRTERVWCDGSVATAWIFSGCRCAAGAQMGVWTAVDLFSVRTADCRRRQDLHRFRFGISLFSRCGHRVRALVVSGPGGVAQHADDRPTQAWGEPDGCVLRRHPRQRVRGRCLHRQAPVENASRRASAGAYHRKRHGPRGARVRSGGLARRARVGELQPRLLHDSRPCRGARCINREADLEDVHDSRGTLGEEERRRHQVPGAVGRRHLGARSRSIPNGRPCMSRQATRSPRRTWAERTR